MNLSASEQRLDGQILSAGCLHCPLLEECGGYTRVTGAWSCMDECATCDNSRCTKVCLRKPAAFVRDLAEVRGFGLRGIGHLGAPLEAGALPRYVPMVQHGRCRSERLHAPWAAVPLSEVFRLDRSGSYRTVAEDADGLRRVFKLGEGTRVLLVGTGVDRVIERYWRFHKLCEASKQIAALGVAAAVAPNYSLALEDPRPQHMANRKRSLVCAKELSAAGVTVIPYLQALTAKDWSVWFEFLAQHEEVSWVAKEFQTGLSHPERGRLTIGELARLQELLGRELHVLAIGGAQYRRLLSQHFSAWTLVDSAPFMKAIKARRSAEPGKERVNWRPAPNEDPGRLLDHNVLEYERWVAS